MSAPTTNAPASQWFYVVNKQKTGPVPFAQLQQLAMAGTLKPADMVLPENSGKWQSASSVAGLFPAPELADSPPRVRVRWGLLAGAISFMTVVGAFLVVLGIAIERGGDRKSAATGSRPTRELVTLNYWNGLNTAYQKVNKSAKPATKPRNAVETSASLKQHSRVLFECANEVARLPVLDVDQESLSVGTLAIEWLRESASLYSDCGDLVLEMQAFADKSTSFEAGVEAFMRGFLGDPLGPINDQRAGAAQFEQRRQRLLSRNEVLEGKLNRLNTEGDRVRVILSQRYNREFPKLD
jgi:hypothetical protein